MQLPPEEIAERQRVEVALQESEERYRRLVENLRDVIFSLSSTGQILYASPAIASLSGYSPEEMQRRLVWAYIHQPDLPLVRASFHQAQTRAIEQAEFRIVTKAGEVRWCQCSMQPVFEHGRLVSMQGVLTDITERKQTELEKEELQAQLFQAQKLEAIGTMAGGIAHDFNNILAIIIGCSELLKDDVPTGTPAYRNLVEVLTASHRAKELVQQLLTFHRPHTPERKSIPLSLVVEEGIRFLRACLPANIELETDVDPQAGAVLADPTQLHQLLLNLGVNAKHAMGETEGVLSVGLHRVEISSPVQCMHSTLQPGVYLKLSVQDTGCGIPIEVQERIFEPFFSTKSPGEGSGMGLSIVHAIVNSHQGAIQLESVPNQGSTFHIYLPRAESSAATIIPGEAAAPVGSGRVLFVDDEEAITFTAQQMLSSLGYEGVVMTSSTEALELFRCDPYAFDAVVTDQTMPRLTGEGLARELLAMRPDLPLIVCSGFSQTFTPEKAKALGVRDYLHKPFSKQELAQSLERALAAPGQRQADNGKDLETSLHSDSSEVPLFKDF